MDNIHKYKLAPLPTKKRVANFGKFAMRLRRWNTLEIINRLEQFEMDEVKITLGTHYFRGASDSNLRLIIASEYCAVQSV